MSLFYRNPATMPGGIIKRPPPPPIDPPPPPGIGDPWYPTGYGYLYNFLTIMDERNIAPTNWEVWDEDSNSNLFNFIKDLEPVDDFAAGPGNRSGRKLKFDWDREVEGFPGWMSVGGNLISSNISKIFFVPGGSRNYLNGGFFNEGYVGFIYINRYRMSGVNNDRINPWGLWTAYSTSQLTSFELPGFANLNLERRGLSIRCYAPKSPSEHNYDYGYLTDIDGNEYRYIVLGDYRYMQENLKVTKYRNGDNINHYPETNDWINATSGAYCAYNNDINYVGYLEEK